MSLRILKIPGRRPEARTTQLKRVQAWMSAAGWRMENYLDEEASALFMRDEEPHLWALHPTRWLPGPGMWHPREWARNLFGVPYRVAVLGLILALAGVVLQGVLSPPAFLTAKNPKRVESLSEGEAQGGEPWKYVNVSSLNVRELPNEGARAVGILYRNQRVLVERTEGDWAQVSKPERGFVSQRYLQDSPAE